MRVMGIQLGLVWLRGWLFALLVGALFAISVTGAESGDQILFVHLRWETNVVSIVRVETRPGRLKASRREEGRLLVQLADSEGRVLSGLPVEDPRVRRYEFPSSTTNGLARLVVSSPAVDRMIRVALPETARELILLGESPSGPQPAETRPSSDASTRPVLQRVSLVRALSPAK